MTYRDLEHYAKTYNLSLDERRRLERGTQLFIDHENDVIDFIYDMMYERNNLENTNNRAKRDE